jgi:hypothetical protein
MVAPEERRREMDRVERSEHCREGLGGPTEHRPRRLHNLHRGEELVTAGHIFNGSRLTPEEEAEREAGSRSMPRTRPVTMLVSYYPKEGKSKALLLLLKKQWSTLNRMGLVSKMPQTIWRRRQTHGAAHIVELFQWTDGRASGRAHRTPEVLAIWNPMTAILESMQLARVEPLATRRA